MLSATSAMMNPWLIIYNEGLKYIRLCRARKILHRTPKAFLAAGQWIPRSLCIIQDDYLYVIDWKYAQCGFH